MHPTVKILFVISPTDFNPQKEHVDRVYGCNYGYDYKPPIHALSATTALKLAGHTVRFVDFHAQGLTAADLPSVVKAFGPDVACFFSVYLSQNEDLETARRISELAPGCWQVFMGSAPSWKPEHYLRRPKDVVVRGEPEATLVELVGALESTGSAAGVLGTSRPDGASVAHEGPRPLMDVDDLPIPDRSLLEGRYVINRLNVQPATTLCTSRGCTHRCTFCAPNAVDQCIELEHKRFGLKRPPFRPKSVEKVVAEFRAIAEAGYKGIEVVDNIFVYDKRRTLELCRAIEPLKLKWLCLARANHLHDDEAIEAMARAGCELVYIGSESFCQEILDDVRKQITVDQVESAVARLKRHHIEPEVSVVLGVSALETPATVRKSLTMAKQCGTRFTHFSIALPLPNTDLYDTAKQKGWLEGGEFVPVDNARESIINLPHLKAREMERILKNAYLFQYFSPSNILAHVKKVRSVKDFVEKAKVPFRFLRYYLTGHGTSGSSR
ncbi:MAG: radical SAM protein [Myxococcales bacterium]